MRAAMKRQHKVVLRVTFDKPVTEAFAVREVADCIYGDFYPTPVPGKPGHDAEKFIVRGAKRYDALAHVNQPARSRR